MQAFSKVGQSSVQFNIRMSGLQPSAEEATDTPSKKRHPQESGTNIC
jgi:hypothetical protein